MNPGPFTPADLAELAASARNHIDTTTPDICPDMPRAEIGQLVVAVGLAMAAETPYVDGFDDVYAAQVPRMWLERRTTIQESAQ